MRSVYPEKDKSLLCVGRYFDDTYREGRGPQDKEGGGEDGTQSRVTVE